jgi:DNA methylase
MAKTKVIDQTVTDRWALYHGDTVDVMRGLPDDRVHYSIFSPPFASLYTYSASPRDMGNVANHSEFYEQYRFAAAEMYRITKPGRLLSFHCMLLPTSKNRDGFIGLTDFRGELIRLHAECGWIHHSEVVIWKDPVTAMQRTKALGLLHKQIRKDASMSRQGIPDYLITMRKPGDNAEPVTHTGEGDDMPVQMWQRYASPVWALTGEADREGFVNCEQDINPSDTLQYRSARDHEDERHICPLQLEVIRRAVKLWTNPGDTVFSPFAGIGSELHTAVSMGRKALGAELKRSYYEQACKNMASATEHRPQLDMFDQAVAS